MIQIVAFRAAILGFENIGVVEFRRKLDFAREFRYWVIRRITLFVLSITLVFALRNYFALAITMPLSATVTVAISYYMSSYRPVFCFKKFKEIWSFPFWILCANYMDYISNRADEIIIGGASSTTMMGHYHIASDLAMLPTREVVLPMTRALAPTYSKISHDRDELAKAFNGIFNVITIICASVALGLFVVAEDVVVVLLGEQWVASIPFFKWLALYGGLEGLVLTTGSFFIIINKQKLFASLNICRVVVLLPALIAASYLADIETIAMTRAGIMLLFVLVVYFTIVQISNISFCDIIVAIWRPLISGVIMAAAVLSLHNSDLNSHILSLAHDVIIGGIIFTTMLFALWYISGRPGGAEKTTLKVGWEQFNRRILKR